MTKLTLHRRDVAGLVDNVASHGMSGCMGALAGDAGYGTDLVPYLVDYQGCKAACAVSDGGRGKEQGG